MSTLKNDRFIRALRRQPVDRTPVWIMRQAGRYLPEYRATRAQAGDFMSLCKNPELACEVTMQPLRRFPLDAAILFSDILTIPDAMGLGLRFEEGEGPIFDKPLRRAQQIKDLGVPDPNQELAYVMNAVSTIRKELDNSVPLIGFSGSPWTLATYMVEGRSSRDHARIKTMMFDDEKSLLLLLDKLSEAVTLYLSAQVDAGAQVLQIFDTWGGVLSADHYHRYSLTPMQKIVSTLKAQHPDIPVILFTKGGGQWLELMAQTGCDALGLDWTTRLADARARVGSKVALQGNLDPAALYASSTAVRNAVADVLADFGPGNGHVFNLGHGITPQVNPERLSDLISAVQELSPAYHAA